MPLLDLGDQYRSLAQPIHDAIEGVLASQHFILGPKVEEFEKAIAKYTGARYAIGVSSGTDALLAILMALGISAADSIITSAYTFFATGGCIARVGAMPIFVDIEPASCNISPAVLTEYFERKCRTDSSGVLRDENSRAIRAIVPVHLFGLCCDMDPILALGRKYRIPVIEDAAQAIGAEYPQTKATAGTMGLAGTLSFYPSKNLGAAGDAGMVLCNDETFAHKVRLCRQHGMEQRYYHHFVGGNFRLDEMQAAILNAKLPQLDNWSAARRAAAGFYRAEFERAGLTSEVTLPSEPYRNSGLTNHHIYHQYIIRTARRDALREHLTKREVGTAIYYPLGLHEQDCFKYLGYHEGDLPETERAARETLALPVYPELSREAQRYVVEAIAEFFASAR